MQKDRLDSAQDILTHGLVARFEATIGAVETGGYAPHGLHWCLAPPTIPMDDLGADGHPKKIAGFPEIALPRRMWASSDVEFLTPLQIGAKIHRISEVAGVEHKPGSSGELVFVRVLHQTFAEGQLSVRETQTLVYRAAATEKAPLPAASGFTGGDFDFLSALTPTPQLLFRYSALTFNTHRIHYDADYAKREEAYPALVVHGPLMASLLLRFATQKLGHSAIKTFAFKGRSPAYCGQQLHLTMKLGGGQHELSAMGADGRLVMSATIGT
ncbi:MAG: MaoC family dehydratase N-terminal domain-containing protein [Pontixanthobacter sp.]